MWLCPVRRLPRLPSSYLDYARHIPKAYVDRMKRTVPSKVFTDRFGAPDVVLWKLHPDDYVEDGSRPWEQKKLMDNLEKENAYHKKRLENKFYHIERNKNKRMADEKWTVFVGDRVQVMVGKDKGKQGTVIQMDRASSQVWVDQMNTKLEVDMDDEISKKYDIDNHWILKEQPLSVLAGEVLLVDPNDHDTCHAKSG